MYWHSNNRPVQCLSRKRTIMIFVHLCVATSCYFLHRTLPIADILYVWTQWIQIFYILTTNTSQKPYLISKCLKSKITIQKFWNQKCVKYKMQKFNREWCCTYPKDANHISAVSYKLKTLFMLCSIFMLRHMC